jgi:Fe-S oxidoreductase
VLLFHGHLHLGGRPAAILNDREGLWRCRTIFNCTAACPREIRITKAIGEVKKAILYGTRDIPIRQPGTSHAAERWLRSTEQNRPRGIAAGPVLL